MSTQYENLQRLLKQQEEERADLMNAAYIKWKEIKERERELLASCDGTFEKASPEIKQQINESRAVFYKEFGAEGELSAVMVERQEKDRKKLIGQLSVQEQLRLYQEQRNKRDKDKDHDR